MPARVEAYPRTARERGIPVIIAAAGLTAHLSGVDDLCALVPRCPKASPVVTVGVENDQNAELLALLILATADSELQDKFRDYKTAMAEEVDRKNQRLQKFGVDGCLMTK